MIEPASRPAARQVRVLHAPVNIANQPPPVVGELRRLGVQATLLEYGPGHPFGYEDDEGVIKLVPLKARHRLEAQVEALRFAVQEATRSCICGWRRCSSAGIT